MGFLHSYVKAPLPPAVYPVDVRAGIADNAWGMCGNGPDPTCTVAPDGVGDCGFAGRQHLKMSKAAHYGETETWETSDQLVEEYLSYDGGQDLGVNLADVLLYWYQAGKILAFAPVDHTDPAAVDAAMQAFRGVYAGVDLTDDADDLFSHGQPWTTANGEQPDSSEGHCIVKVYADDPAKADAEDAWVTWGAVQRSTKAWTMACATEAFVIVTSEDEAAKVDMTALRADIEALGGTGGSKPQPEPKEGGTTMFEAFEAKLTALWHTLDGEAKAELRQALADLKAEVANAEPLLTEFEAGLKALLVAAEPQLKADAEALLAKLLADFAPMLGKAPAAG